MNRTELLTKGQLSGKIRISECIGDSAQLDGPPAFTKPALSPCTAALMLLVRDTNPQTEKLLNKALEQHWSVRATSAPDDRAIIFLKQAPLLKTSTAQVAK